MPRGLRAKIEGGEVVLIAVIDTDSVPSWMAGWPDGDGLQVGMVDDGQGGYAFYVPTQVEIDAALEAQVQANTDDLIQNDKKFRVIAELIFDTLKATKTGNLDTDFGAGSTYGEVTDPASYRDHVVARFRALN